MTEPTDNELQALWSDAVLPDTVTKRLAFSFARAVLAKWGTPPAVAPWRSAVLDLIDECPGLTMGQDQWLSRRIKELDFASAPQPTQAQAGAVVVTTDTTGRCVAVTRQDEEGRVLSVIWQAPEAQAGAVPQRFTKAQQERLYQNRPKDVGKGISLADWRRTVTFIEAAHGIKGEKP